MYFSDNNYIYQFIGHLESLVSAGDKRKKFSQTFNMDKCQKNGGRNMGITSQQHDESEKSTVKKLVQKLRQNDNPTDSESVKDLVQNLTNLALAITEERFDANLDHGVTTCNNNNKKKLTVSNSEGHNGDRSGDEFFAPGEKKYERKFHSLDKKLKRTNLMKRRESQALLEGIRKSRQSNPNIMSELSIIKDTN